MTEPRTATIRIPCDSPRQAERVRDAIRVETESAPPRTSARIEVEKEVLVLSLAASDTRGLRAATNSFLRWVATALEVARLAERPSESFKRPPSSLR